MCCTQPISACYFLCNRFLLCVYSVWIVFRASFLFSLVLIWYTLISSDPVQCELSSRHTTLTIIFRFITDENWYPGGSLICVAICSCSEIYLRAFHAPTYPPTRSLRCRCSCYPTHSLDAAVWISHTSLLVTPPQQTHSAHIPTSNLPLIMCYLQFYFFFVLICTFRFEGFYLQESMKSRTESLWFFCK